MDTPPINRELIQKHLDRVLLSEGFRRAERSSALLRYIVEQTVNGRAEELKEYTLGVEALGRGDAFDPRTDPIVRAEASRLRARLERYYETQGSADLFVIMLPRGSYVAQFADRTAANDSVIDKATEPERSTPQSFRLHPPAWIALFGLLAVAAIAALWWSRSGSPIAGESPILQFDVELKSEGVVGSEVGTDVVLSPDGSRLVFGTRDLDGLTHLNTRRLDQSGVIQLPETEGARNPFISPDGRWVGFWAAGKLKKISVDGGSPVVLCDAVDVFGASWQDESSIIAAIHPSHGLWRIPAAGGAPELLLDLSQESAFPSWPQVLPGGRFVIYTVLGAFGADRANIEVRAFESGERKVLIRGGTYARYLPNGYLTYVNQGTLYAVPFDISNLSVTGAAVPMLENISYSRTFGHVQMDISQSGALVYRQGDKSNRFVVEWLSRSEKTTPLLAKPGRYEWFRVSPDGKRVVYSDVESGAASICVYDIERDELKRLTTSADAYNTAVLSPDGAFLVLGGRTGMAWIAADRPDKPHPLTTTNTVQVPFSFTPDRRRLAYYELDPVTGFDLYTIAVKTVADGIEFGSPEPFLQTPAFGETYPSFSPDGRWLAYNSNESGSLEVYVRAFPDNGTKVRVSNAGGSLPKWSPNGRELFYRTWDHRLMVASYKVVNGSFVADTPKVWSSQLLGDTGVLPNFDVGADGERLAALLPVTRSRDQQSQNHVTFLLNFSEVVRRRAAPAKNKP
jgi:serine/threonine-protein kinase